MSTVPLAARAVAAHPVRSKFAWSEVAPSALHQLKVRALWAFFAKQRPSFWLICVYAFFEYVRPQAIYAPISGLPFASWTLMLCLGAFLMEGVRLRETTRIDSLLLLFTCIVVASGLTAFSPSTAYGEMVPTYMSWLVIFFLITNIVDTDKKFLVFMALYFLWCMKMSQHGTRSFVFRGFAFARYGVTCGPQFFNNSGECGIQMAMFFPASLYFVLGLKKYLSRRTFWLAVLMPASAAMTIVGSSSRGGQLALAAVLLWIVLRSRRRFRALAIAAVAALALYAVMPEEQIERFRTMGTDETSMNRRQYWEDGIKIMNEHPILGIGFDNWMAYYGPTYNRWQLPHNIFVEAGAELGYTGLLAFVALIVATFVFNYRTRKMAARLPEGSFLWNMAHGLDGALIGFLVGGFFVTVLYYPFFWINLAMTATLYNVTRRAVRRAGVAARVPVQRTGSVAAVQPGYAG